MDARNATWWACNRLLGVASRGKGRIYRYCFVAQPVANMGLAPASRSRSIAIRVVSADDALVRQFPRPAEVIAKRFQMGAKCIAAERNGEFVGFIWLKEARYDEDEVRCIYMLEPEGVVAWDFDVHIEPQFRSGRTFARLWDTANDWLREHGYRWTISRISAFNPASLSAHRRLGIRVLGTATFLCIGSWQVTLLGQAPFVHLGWRNDQVPILRLRAPPSSNSYNRVPHPPFESS
jgi:hypothetical protein